jgi:hypothetical protein
MCPIFLYIKRDFTMKKPRMIATKQTFEEGCNKYLECCQQRNSRQRTINHSKQSYTKFYNYYDPQMPIEEINEQNCSTPLQ